RRRCGVLCAAGAGGAAPGVLALGARGETSHPSGGQLRLSGLFDRDGLPYRQLGSSAVQRLHRAAPALRPLAGRASGGGWGHVPTWDGGGRPAPRRRRSGGRRTRTTAGWEHRGGGRHRRRPCQLLSGQKAKAAGRTATGRWVAGVWRGAAASDRRTIEDRFALTGDEGATYEYVGSVTEAVKGGAFLYTNRESLSLGVIVQVASLTAGKVPAYELLERFKAH